jgi:hypothetical protein
MIGPGRISVRFFLNKNVNPIISSPLTGSVDLFPLYIQVTYNRKNTQFRSFFQQAYSSMEQLYNDKEAKEKIAYEESLIKKVVEFEVKHKKQNFQLKGFQNRYLDFATGVDYIIDKYIRNKIDEALDKTNSKFKEMLNPYHWENISLSVYFEATQKLVEDFSSFLPEDFSLEMNFAHDFITWSQKRKKIPELIEWLDQSLIEEYKLDLKKGEKTPEYLEKSTTFIHRAIRIQTGFSGL